MLITTPAPAPAPESTPSASEAAASEATASEAAASEAASSEAAASVLETAAAAFAVFLHESERPTGSRGFGRGDDHAVLEPLEELLTVPHAPLLLVRRVLGHLEADLVERVVDGAVGVVASIPFVVDGHLAGGGHLDHVLVVYVHHHRAVVALEHALALCDREEGEEEWGEVGREKGAVSQSE